jgi:hypothetical protein
MKILKISTAFILLCTTIVSCGEENKDTGNAASDNTSSNQTEVKSSESTKDLDTSSMDLSSPTKAVESFINSSQQQDAEKLSQCFSINCEKEFQMIVKKEMKEKDLKEFQEFCLGAKVLEEKIEGNVATVKVKFSKRDENIRLELVDGKWGIVAF